MINTDVSFNDSIISLVNHNVDLQNVKFRSLSFSNVLMDICKEDLETGILTNQKCGAFNQFLNVSSTTDIVFSETTMNFTDLRNEEWGIDIKESTSVKFIKSTLVGLRTQSLRVNSKSIIFERSHLMYVEKGAIEIIESENLTISKSTIDFLYEKGIKATVNNVLMIDSTLKNTQRKALMGLVGKTAPSILVLRNLTLDDPARGALITPFNAGIKKLAIDRCEYFFR